MSVHFFSNSQSICQIFNNYFLKIIFLCPCLLFIDFELISSSTLVEINILHFEWFLLCLNILIAVSRVKMR